MKLNLEYHQEKEELITDVEQDLIDNYINKFDSNMYEEHFPDDLTDKHLYYLSCSSQNILNWYPFSKDDTLLELGGDLGQLTQVFVDTCKDVTTIEPNMVKAKAIAKRFEKEPNLEIIAGNLININLNKKFNYIVIMGLNRIVDIFGKNMKLMQILKYLEQYLEDNGKFLVALDNKFGLRYFVGNPENILNKKFESIIGYSNESEKIETFTKSRLERILKENGYYTNFYYPLPDYKLPNVIFSDNQLPKYNSIDKYIPYTTSNSTIIMNEIDVFREILKNNEEMFTFFTNSFLLEISKNVVPIKYKYISFNNLRKEKYRLTTKITDEYVEKQLINEKSNEHYENIKNNIKILQNQNIKTIDFEENGVIKSKYIKQEYLLNNVLTKALEEKNFEKVDKIIDKYIETLKINTYKENDYEKTVFEKYKIDCSQKSIINDLHFKKDGLWDMTFKNCFYIDCELYFFDQEWNEENLPIEYILYRSILYTISLRRFININDWFEKYGLKEFIPLFEKLDSKLQDEIKEEKIWNFYNTNKYFDIDATKQELNNVNIRNNAQQLAMENLKNEKDKLEQEFINYKAEVEQRLSSRIHKKMKRLMGGKSE